MIALPGETVGNIEMAVPGLLAADEVDEPPPPILGGVEGLRFAVAVAVNGMRLGG